MAVTPHAQSLLDLAERVDVVAAFSRSAARRDAFAKRFPFPVTGDIAAVAEDKSIDAVLVLTPPNAHLEIVRTLAGAGKHILLEKPVEITTPRAIELVETCRRAGVTLGMVFQHRFREVSERLAR